MSAEQAIEQHQNAPIVQSVDYKNLALKLMNALEDIGSGFSLPHDAPDRLDECVNLARKVLSDPLCIELRNK